MNEEQKYTVVISNKTKKQVRKMPEDIQDIFVLLVEDIKKKVQFRKIGIIFLNWEKTNTIAI